MDRLRSVGREHGVLGRRGLHANFQAFDIFHLVDLSLAVHVPQAQRGQGQHVDTLHRLVDHVPYGLGHLGVGERLGEVLVRAKQKMQRKDACLRRESRGVGRRGNREIKVAGSQKLKDLRLLPQLSARILFDDEGIPAELGELGSENVRGDAVAGRARLIVGKPEALDVL